MNKRQEYIEKFFQQNLHNNKYFLKLDFDFQELLIKILREKLMHYMEREANVIIQIAALPFLNHENLFGAFAVASYDYPEDDMVVALRDELRNMDFPTTVRDQALNISESLRKSVIEGHSQVFYDWIANYNKKNKGNKI